MFLVTLTWVSSVSAVNQYSIIIISTAVVTRITSVHTVKYNLIRLNKQICSINLLPKVIFWPLFSGVKLLVSLVQVNPEYSIHYQQLIVKSLENSDLSIQKKVLADACEVFPLRGTGPFKRLHMTLRLELEFFSFYSIYVQYMYVNIC